MGIPINTIPTFIIKMVQFEYLYIYSIEPNLILTLGKRIPNAFIFPNVLSVKCN